MIVASTCCVDVPPHARDAPARAARSSTRACFQSQLFMAINAWLHGSWLKLRPRQTLRIVDRLHPLPSSNSLLLDEVISLLHHTSAFCLTEFHGNNLWSCTLIFLAPLSRMLRASPIDPQTLPLISLDQMPSSSSPPLLPLASEFCTGTGW